MRNILLTLSISLSLVLSGCKGDPSTPEYWQKSISSGKKKKDKVARVEALRAAKVATPAAGVPADAPQGARVREGR
jgi:hypothetical protein